MLGEQGLQEVDLQRPSRTKKADRRSRSTSGWLGITDKYWAATLLPDPTAAAAGALLRRASSATLKTYQADYLLRRRSRSRRAAAASATARLFAGAKEVAVVDGYDKEPRAQPLRAADRLGLVLLHHQADVPGRSTGSSSVFGNFGVAILLVTVLVKAIFFPLANKSYTSMSEDEEGAAADGDAHASATRTTR